MSSLIYYFYEMKYFTVFFKVFYYSKRNALLSKVCCIEYLNIFRTHQRIIKHLISVHEIYNVTYLRKVIKTIYFTGNYLLWFTKHPQMHYTKVFCYLQRFLQLFNLNNTVHLAFKEIFILYAFSSFYNVMLNATLIPIYKNYCCKSSSEAWTWINSVSGHCLLSCHFKIE